MAETSSGTPSGGFVVVRPEAESESENNTGSFRVERIVPQQEESTDETSSAAYILDSIEPRQKEPRKRGRKAGVSNAPKLTDLSESLELAKLSLGTLNALAVTMVGPHAAMSEGEKGLLYPPTSRIFRRLPNAAAAKASVFVDPLVIVFGLALWVRRIATLQQEARSRDNRIDAAEFARASGISWDGANGNASPPNASGERNGTATPSSSAPTGGIPTEIINTFGTDLNGGDSVLPVV